MAGVIAHEHVRDNEECAGHGFDYAYRFLSERTITLASTVLVQRVDDLISVLARYAQVTERLYQCGGISDRDYVATRLLNSCCVGGDDVVATVNVVDNRTIDSRWF